MHQPRGGFLVPVLLLSWLVASVTAWAANFGTVIPITGHASDLALDERRGLVYVANLTANRIEIFSTADLRLRDPIGVRPQPASLALSPDQRYLVVTHFSNFTGPGTASSGLTILDLDGSVRQNVTLGAAPLAVAFGNGSRALVVTTSEFFLLDPVTGTLESVGVTPLTSGTLPVPFATFPPDILRAAVGVSGDGNTIYVLAEGETTSAVLHYRVPAGVLNVIGLTATPPLGPRVVSVNQDGSRILSGWGLHDPRLILLAQFPAPSGQFSLGSHAFDFERNLIYAQIPRSATTTEAPVLHVVDSDNLTVRERIRLSQNLTGRSLLSADRQKMYAVSDSGVMVLPVGTLERAPRVEAQQEALVFRSNACDRRVLVQELNIEDLGGGRVDFALSVPQGTTGVRILPGAGVTPQRVRVEVDPTVFQNAKGTTVVPVEIQSAAAVNLPRAVRLLINTREPDQRGSFVSVPGKIVDVMADPARDRFYLLRQDRNQVQVYDSAGLNLIATLRTGNTPVQMAITRDGRHLLVTNDNSQILSVFDLETLEAMQPVEFPPGNYPRSLAVSNTAILATARSVSGPHKIHRVDLEARIANALPTLGIYKNEIHVDTTLATSPTGATVLAVMPNGTVLLYEAAADTFVASRKDFSTLGGAYAAVTDHLFVAGNHLLDRALVPIRQLGAETGASSGFVFLEGQGLRASSPSATGPGVVDRVDLGRFDTIRPTRIVESPVTAPGLRTETVGQIGQAILPFTRTLAPLRQGGSILMLSASGFTVLAPDYDAALAIPVISGLENLADGGNQIAPGGLVAITGRDLSGATAVNREVPVATSLGDVCATINNAALPLFRVSPTRILAQLPFGVTGGGRLIVRSPGGVSAAFDLTLPAAAPAVFHTGVAGPDTGLPLVFRAKNNELTTLSNPVHPLETILVFATGLGRTAPQPEDGAPSPFDPLASALLAPVATLGETPLEVLFAGLVPGEVGVYQLNLFVPRDVPEGMQIPLTIRQGLVSTTFHVRVVKP